jgi:hypothetical protein
MGPANSFSVEKSQAQTEGLVEAPLRACHFVAVQAVEKEVAEPETGLW